MARRRDVTRLQDEIHELFSELWHVPRVAGFGHSFRPAADCFRTDDPPQIVVVVELAGIDPADVEIVAADGALVVSGIRRRPRPAHRVSFRQMEIDYGPFRRSVRLDDDADTARAQATYERGLLTIVVPLAEAPRKTRRKTI